MMDREWFVPIEGFEDYRISNHGRIFNRYGREMVFTPNTQGELTVGLVRDRRQTRYSVKCLVARTFVGGESEAFNTPIYLDGDMTNLRADNIVWRPRWFAWKYKQQFRNAPPWYTSMRVMDLATLDEYNNIKEAAMAHGLLCADILMSIYNETSVYPTGQAFAHVL